MDYKTLENGDILFNHKNETPPNLKLHNYTVDPNNAWLYHPNFPDCIYRVYTNKITKCKKMYGVWTCKIKNNETVVPDICNPCTLRVEQLIEIGNANKS